MGVTGHLHRAKRLAQMQQRGETMLDVAVKKAAAGTKSILIRDQPEMRDTIRQARVAGQIGQQRFISADPLFGRQDILALTAALKTVTRANGADGVARVAQTLNNRLRNSGMIGKDQPLQGLAKIC